MASASQCSIRWRSLLNHVFLNLQFRVVGWHGDAKPDEWQQWIGQEIHPAEIANALTVRQVQVQPDVQELVDAQAWYVILPKLAGQKMLPPNIVVAFKARNPPSQRTISQLLAGRLVSNSDVLA